MATPTPYSSVLIRTKGDPLILATSMRRELLRTRPEFSVRTLQTQSDFVRWHLVRERLLASLSFFFAVVALVLAATGLYGVLNYSVTRQRREIGIRMALGARARHVVTKVTVEIATMIGLGSAAGVAAGLAMGRFVESLLYGVKTTDAWMIATPIVTLAVAAVLAGLPPATRAAKIDPAQVLRND